MAANDHQMGEEFVRLGLAINEHLPGYVDSYIETDEWLQEAKRAGKLPVDKLAKRVDRLAVRYPRPMKWTRSERTILHAT